MVALRPTVELLEAPVLEKCRLFVSLQIKTIVGGSWPPYGGCQAMVKICQVKHKKWDKGASHMCEELRTLHSDGFTDAIVTIRMRKSLADIRATECIHKYFSPFHKLISAKSTCGCAHIAYECILRAPMSDDDNHV